MIRLNIQSVDNGFGIHVDYILEPPLVVGPMQYTRMCDRANKAIDRWCREQWGDPLFQNGWSRFLPTSWFFVGTHDRAIALKMRWDGASYAEFL